MRMGSRMVFALTLMVAAAVVITSAFELKLPIRNMEGIAGSPTHVTICLETEKVLEAAQNLFPEGVRNRITITINAAGSDKLVGTPIVLRGGAAAPSQLANDGKVEVQAAGETQLTKQITFLFLTLWEDDETVDLIYIPILVSREWLGKVIKQQHKDVKEVEIPEPGMQIISESWPSNALAMDTTALDGHAPVLLLGNVHYIWTQKVTVDSRQAWFLDFVDSTTDEDLKNKATPLLKAHGQVLVPEVEPASDPTQVVVHFNEERTMGLARAVILRGTMAKAVNLRETIAGWVRGVVALGTTEPRAMSQR